MSCYSREETETPWLVSSIQTDTGILIMKSCCTLICIFFCRLSGSSLKLCATFQWKYINNVHETAPRFVSAFNHRYSLFPPLFSIKRHYRKRNLRYILTLNTALSLWVHIHTVLILHSVMHAALRKYALPCMPHYNSLHSLIELNGPGFRVGYQSASQP